MRFTWSIVFAILLVGILAAPLFTRNHIYSGIVSHSDYSYFVSRIADYSEGRAVTALYPAEVVIGYLIVYTSKATGIPYASIYLWFVFFSLFAASATIYWVAAKLSKAAGWVALLTTVFCTVSILVLFSYSIVANILNVYVLLLLAIYFGVKSLDGGGVAHLAASLVLFALFSALHVSAFYLPYMAAVLAVVIVGLIVFRRAKLYRHLSLVACVAVVNIVISSFMLHNWVIGLSLGNPSVVAKEVAPALLGSLPLPVTEVVPIQTQFNSPPVPWEDFLFLYVGGATLGLAVVTVAMAFLVRPKFTALQKMWLVTLVSMAIPLYIGTLTGLSPESMRSALEASTLTAFAVSIVFSVCVQQSQRYKVLSYGGYMFIGAGSLFTLAVWFA